MKLVLLTTAAHLRPEAIEKIEEALGVDRADAEVTVVLWYPHEQPLPVKADLLIGPHLRLDRRTRRVAVAPANAETQHHSHAGSEHPRPHTSTVRRVIRRVSRAGLGVQYAASAYASREVSEAIRTADVVVALEKRTHLAAWLMARRHPEPAVVAGVAAAKRTIEGLSRH